MKVNSAGVSYANAEIKSGNYKTGGSWDFTAEDGNKLLGENGDDWANYGKHHLAVNPDAEKETKAYYKYPFAKADGVYRKGLIAAKQRAAQQGQTDIEDAAGKLIDAIDKKEGKSVEMDVFVSFGGEVKSFGGGKIGGQLVTFGDATKTDLETDFFDDITDYDQDFTDAVKTPVYYNHGTDPVLGKKKLGNGIKATLTKNDVGIWIEAQLDERNEYEAAILKLVDQKKLGWSSGTAAYLVEREPVGKAMHIKKWPLGIDASLTPTPAEPRNTAVALKYVKLPTLESLIEGKAFATDDTVIGDDVIESITFAGYCNLSDRLLYCGLWQILYSDILTNEQKQQKIEEAFDKHAELGKQVTAALIPLMPDEMQQQYAVAKSLYFDKPEEKQFHSFRQQLEFVKSAVEALQKRAATIKENFENSETKTGAVFNAKNREYLQSLGGDLVMHGNKLMDLVTPMSSDDTEKSINTAELKLAQISVQHFEALQL